MRFVLLALLATGCASTPVLPPQAAPPAIQILPAAITVGQPFTVRLVAAMRPGNTDVYPEDGTYRAQLEQVDVVVPGLGGWLTGEPIRFAPTESGLRTDLGAINVVNGAGEASFKLDASTGTPGRGIYVYVDSPKRLFGTGARVL